VTLTLQHVLIFSVALFAAGAAGACVRRNALMMLISIQVMLSASVVAMAGFARWNLLPEGNAAIFFMIAIIAVQAAVGLALLVATFSRCGTMHADEMRLLKD